MAGRAAGPAPVAGSGVAHPGQPAATPGVEAFGWHVETTDDGRLRISKGGGSDDFASQLLYYPRERVVIVWATNNLRQRWRQTLNTTLPALVLDGTATRSFASPRARRFRRDATGTGGAIPLGRRNVPASGWTRIPLRNEESGGDPDECHVLPSGPPAIHGFRSEYRQHDQVVVRPRQRPNSDDRAFHRSAYQRNSMSRESREVGPTSGY